MTYQNTILGKIIETKKEELSSAKYRVPLKDVKAKAKDAAKPLDFSAHLDPENYGSQLPTTRIIAEIKKASPSGGMIREKFEPARIAQEYIDAGAAALSVLTDGHYFQGSLHDFDLVRKVSALPMLRKDFMIDEYQIQEARAHGADCILAIVAVLEMSRLEDFCGLSSDLGMCTLIEVHDDAELQVALSLKQKSPRLILGINNRNLKSLVTDLSTTEKLISKIPSDRIVVSESGLKSRGDIERMMKAGAKAFLIGEHLLREKELGKKFKEMIGE